MKRIKINFLNKKSAFALCIVAISACALVFGITACDPSYPKEKLDQAVKDVCKNEYDMNVDVSIAGETMGIYYPMEGLLDATLNISEDAWDRITNLLQVASRVVLSTDANIKFYCIIAQDVRLPELQVVIIKYVDDVKRGMFRSISRDESLKRTLFSINLTPQAEKEKSVEKVFEKLGVEQNTAENVLEEFFRSPPAKLKDVGYWKGHFYLKDVSLPEFLAAQAASRIKLGFRSEEELKGKFDFRVSEGEYSERMGIKTFILKFKIDEKGPRAKVGILRREKIENIIDIFGYMMKGYKFKDYDIVILDDQLENAILRIKEKDIDSFDKKEMDIENIVIAPSGYFIK